MTCFYKKFAMAEMPQQTYLFLDTWQNARYLHRLFLECHEESEADTPLIHVGMV